MFLSFSEFNDQFNGQRNFLSSADELLERAIETKMVLNVFFTAKSGNFSLNFAIFCKFSKISVFLFDLFTNMARKLKVAESSSES